jgi:hypothetical protein
MVDQDAKFMCWLNYQIRIGDDVLYLLFTFDHIRMSGTHVRNALVCYPNQSAGVVPVKLGQR